MTTESTDELDPSSSARRSVDIPSFLGKLFAFMRPKSDPSLRETIEEYIVEDTAEGELEDSSTQHERVLLSNILQLRNLTVDEIMIPRADIKALDIDTPERELLKVLCDIQVSRVPVYRETLDNVVGTVHLKDILTALSSGKPVILSEIISEIPIISPAMPLLDLLLKMRHSQRHMAMVIDEYGGIDGLVTMGDIIESIVGEINDEHDLDDDPEMIEGDDGTIMADARVDLDEFEAEYGLFLTNDERDDIDTLGGLVFDIAGHVPVRGEVLTHSSGLIFEVIDADPRKINRLRIRDINVAVSDASAG